MVIDINKFNLLKKRMQYDSQIHDVYDLKNEHW